MNKKVFGRKLSRSRPAREALFASIARAMLLNGKVETTRAKAKATLGMLEKMITVSKKGTVAGMRRVLADLDNQRDALNALYQEVAPSFTRTSGFIRLIQLPNRKGDNAQMVRMEWTDKIVKKIVPAGKQEKIAKEPKKKEVKKVEKSAKKVATKKETKK